MKTPSITSGLRRSAKWDQIDLDPALGGRDPEEHAYEQGRRNLPPSGAAVPDSMERMLTDHYTSQHQSLTLRATDHVRQLHREANEQLLVPGHFIKRTCPLLQLLCFQLTTIASRKTLNHAYLDLGHGLLAQLPAVRWQ